MSHATQIGPVSPFFIVKNLEVSINYYVDQLGFEIVYQTPSDEPFFVIVRRDNAQFMLKNITEDLKTFPNPKVHPLARWDAYIYVSNPEELFKQKVVFKSKLSETDDEMLGFEVEDPDDYVIFIGRPV